jgi:hypothetical protein
MDYQEKVKELLDKAVSYNINPNPVSEQEIEREDFDRTRKIFHVFEAVKTKLKGLYGDAFVIPDDIFGEKGDFAAFSAQWFLKNGEHGKFSVIGGFRNLKLKFTRNLLKGYMKVATEFPSKSKEAREGKPEDYADVKLDNGVYYFLRRRLDQPFASVTIDPTLFNNTKDTFETRTMAFIDAFLLA